MKTLSGIWVVWSIALFFVLLSWVISFYLIYKHLKYYTQPEHQRYIVRLLCMVPLYGLYSVLSLIFHQHQVSFILFLFILYLDYLYLFIFIYYYFSFVWALKLNCECIVTPLRYILLLLATVMKRMIYYQ